MPPIEGRVILAFEAAFTCVCGKPAFCPIQGKRDLSGLYSVTHRCQSCDRLWKVDVVMRPAEDQAGAVQLLSVALPDSPQNQLLRKGGQVTVLELHPPT